VRVGLAWKHSRAKREEKALRSQISTSTRRNQAARFEIGRWGCRMLDRMSRIDSKCMSDWLDLVSVRRVEALFNAQQHRQARISSPPFFERRPFFVELNGPLPLMSSQLAMSRYLALHERSDERCAASQSFPSVYRNRFHSCVTVPIVLIRLRLQQWLTPTHPPGYRIM
jgi:hypothetical protein